MAKNFKMIVEYDGTSFFGWQRQKDKKTIQGELEKNLSLILNQPVKVSGSGRTDAGVHAWGQVASFHADTNLAVSDIKQGVNSIIKQPIVIRQCEVVDDAFHAQYNAVSKEYHYHILNREDPCAIYRQYQWHIKKKLDINAMNQCCQMLIGSMDYKSFENTGSPRKSRVREVFSAMVSSPDETQVIFSICASGFLKYMVRNIVGTLVQVGIKKITTSDFKAILLSCDRRNAGPTAPAHGLFLYRVNY
jgi:tRNA pseudouridine38-40 synthase